MTDREAFEAWAAENHYDTRDPHDPALVDAWQGWKARAARAQPAQAVPVLTDAEIHAADPIPQNRFDQERIEFARRVEKAVRAKFQPTTN